MFTVRISEDTNTLIGVYYSQHGEAQFVATPSLDGTHPIVYPGWNSHANYAVSGTNINTQILDSPGVIPVSWLKVVDVTTNSGNFVYYKQAESVLLQWSSVEALAGCKPVSAAGQQCCSGAVVEFSMGTGDLQLRMRSSIRLRFPVVQRMNSILSHRAVIS